MNDNSTPEFKIRLDEEPTRTNIKTPAGKETQSVKKLGRRLTLTVLLLFTLVVGAMVAGYLDIKKRLLTVHHSGTQEAQNLSSDLQSKFSSLSLKSATVEETLASLTSAQSALNTAIETLKQDLSKLSKRTEELGNAKADKKSLKSSAASLGKKISPLSKAIENQKKTISAIEKSTKKEISSVTNKVRQVTKDTKAFQEKIDAVRAEKASKKDLLSEVDHIQKSQDKLEIELKRVITRLETNIDRLEEELARVKSGASKPTTAPKSTTPPPSTPIDGAKPAGTTSGKPSPVLKPGELLEQDINQ